jgi:hypothetical protein
VVIEAPSGAHPIASHGFYVEDEEAIAEYVAASVAYRNAEMRTWNAYLEQRVTGPADHRAYLAALSPDRLAGLANAVHA